LLTYAQEAYDGGLASSRYKTLLLAIHDRAGELRGGQLRPAWRALTKWEKVEPSRPTVPMPFSVFAAMFVATHLQGLEDLATALLVGWYAALPEHKTKHRAGVGLKHAVIRDVEVIGYLAGALAGRRAEEHLFRGSEHTFERLFTSVRERLSLPGGQGRGFTPASLRTGRATDLYLDGARVDDISWQLRHDNDRTRSHYIQEAGCALAVASLSPAARALVAELAPAFRPILRDRAGRRPTARGTELRALE